MKSNAFVALILGVWLMAPFAATAAEIILNEDFEAPFVAFPRETQRAGAFERSGALTKGWKDNSEAGDVHVKYGASEEAYDGKQALRIEAQPVTGKGAAQLIYGRLPVKKGRVYVFSLALQSNDSIPVEVGLRASGRASAWLVKDVITPAPEWKVWDFTGVAPKDDPAAIFMLRIDKQGAVEVDNLRIEALTEQEFARQHPPQPGNLLESTRFPLGSTNGWTLPRGAPYAFEVARDQPGPSGAPSLEIGGPSGSSPLISPPMQLRPGQPHTVSFWVKSAAPGAQGGEIQAELRLTQQKEHASVAKKSFTVGAKWQRCVMSGKTPIGAAPAYLVLSATSPVLLDGVQVEEGKTATAYASMKPVEVCAVPTRQYGIFFEGEPLEFKVAATGRWDKGAAIKARIVDLFNRANDLPQITLAQSPFETKITIPLKEIPLGFYRLELQVHDGQGKAISAYGEALATRIFRPRFPDEDRPDSPFGIHILPNEKQASLVQSLGFKWIRCHDGSPELTKWFWVEPKRGEWNWQDAKVDLFRNHHLMILGLLDTTPAWACRAETATKDPKHSVPADLNAWSNYCRTITARYKGKIDFWEVWNEPYNLGFWHDVVNGKMVHASAEQFAEVTKRACAAAHEGNPNCTVMTSIGSSFHVPKWTEECVKAGGVNCGDMYVHHLYCPSILGGPDDTAAKKLKAWQNQLPEGLRSRTVWDTEGGPVPQTHTFYSHLPTGGANKNSRYLADFVARYYISNAALGIPKFFLYSFHNHGGIGNPGFMLLNGDGTLEPLATAVSVLAWHIEGKHFVRMVTLSPTAWAYLFTDGKTSVAAIVEASGMTYKLGKIEGAECRDLCGNVIALPSAVGPETCYLTTAGSADSLAKALGAK